ncbi:MAG: integrase [Acinetobacter johnsonii]|uniref:Integrase n=1 Tax=Acinetobacter johnsonii TaxID=40214 RepID=A0A2W5T1U4_ACIJO|nr:MAG: integrase [Acinetobacter johnsonii]
MLTDIQVKSLKPKEKRYSMADGEGLSIEVFPTGKKKWVLSYRIEGKQTRKQLGEYPEVGCKEIRKVARDFKAEVSGKSKVSHHLKQVCDEWFELMSPQWSSEKYISTVKYRLDYITEDFLELPLDEITRFQVSSKVKEIVAKGTLETATRCLRLLNAVFNFAIASGYTEKNPCILVGELIPEHEVQSYPCLPASEMPEFFRRLEQCNAFPITKVVLKLACFTGTRISELLKARWDSGEIDFENKVWLIPAFRMKRRKELMVPLSPQVYNLFMVLFQTRSDDGFIFKHTREPWKHMTSETPLAVIKRNGYANEMVTHGFRTLFSTHANESKLFRAEVIDYQIAHVNKTTKADKTSKIYNRAEYWPERVELMNWYSNEVEKWIV